MNQDHRQDFEPKKSQKKIFDEKFLQKLLLHT